MILATITVKAQSDVYNYLNHTYFEVIKHKSNPQITNWTETIDGDGRFSISFSYINTDKHITCYFDKSKGTIISYMLTTISSKRLNLLYYYKTNYKEVLPNEFIDANHKCRWTITIRDSIIICKAIPL